MSPFAGQIAQLFTAHGGHTYDESVSMTDHMLQTATLASAADCADHLVLAALLHDIGHLLLAEQDLANPSDSHRHTDLHHEDLAAAFLRPHLPEIVVAPIALHVSAKRYLCATDDEYLARLSPASTHTLALQGGPFLESEVTAFQDNPDWQDALLLRRFDDDAKVSGTPTPTVEEFLARLLPSGGNRK